MKPKKTITNFTHKSLKQYHNSLSIIIFEIFFFFCSAEKEIDFAEQVESVAYVLCGEGTINFEKFRHIWHAKGVRNSNI